MIKLFENKKFLFLLFLINIFAGLYSIQFYLSQLKTTNPLLWLFVIDCPLYSIIFGIVLLLKIKDKSIPLLTFISISGNIKYSLWTLFVLLMISGLLDYYVLTIGHILLFIETIVLYRKEVFKLKHYLFVLIWFLLNDFFDYVLGIHPFFIGNFEIVAIFAIISSFLVTFFVSLIFSKAKNIKDLAP
jgi:uncharacterized membrane protein YpjA